MDSWERFNETSLPGKKDFYNELTLEDISDKDYLHAQKVFEEFCRDIGDYHDLYVQCDETSVLIYTNMILICAYPYPYISYLRLD